MKAYSYFDEDYFQNGQKRGTAYSNYKEGARNSPTFREIAAAVREIFQPKRVLEIGCATGVMVRHLNEFGCEAHGIDVSEWAVRNAEHPNVRLSSADNLPYPDAHFDLVMSCHSLEHLPDAIFARAIDEINRVAAAFQFHMLPMIGTPPYDGDPAVVASALRKDPTHQQLHTQQWWLDCFQSRAWTPVDTCVLLKNETPTAELSIGQFILHKASAPVLSGVLHRSRIRNQRLFRDMQASKLAGNACEIGIRGAARLSYKQRVWKDVEHRLSNGDRSNLKDKSFQLVVIVDGEPCRLRFAAGEDVDGQAYAHVGEFHFAVQPGCNIFRFTTEQLKTLRGSPNYSKINHLAVGGENENAEILLYFSDQDGVPVLN